MKIQRTLSESAFLVNESRARRVDISLDRYAQLWVSDTTKELWEDFAKKVYPYDAIELGLRNRFFLDQLRMFIGSVVDPVFVNMGAGFTSYPFLVEEPCRCIEVDLNYVIEYKQKQIETWIQKGKLPDRRIEYISADLSCATERKHLQIKLRSVVHNDLSFILFEGITYYLNESVLTALFELCAALQKSGSVLAFDYWDPSIESNPVFLRLKRFFAERFGYKETSYTLFDSDFIQRMQGYTVVEYSDIQKLEKRYLPTTLLKKKKEILPENYVVLKRK